MMNRIEAIVITDSQVSVCIQQQLDKSLILLGDGIVDGRVALHVLETRVSI